MSMTLAQLAKLVKGRVIGDPEVQITGIAGLEEAGPGDITFLGNPRYAHLARTTGASALLAAEKIQGVDTNIIQVENPDWAFAQIVEVFAPAPPKFAPGIHKLAVVAEDVSLGKDVSVQALSVLEEKVSLGDRTLIYPQVYVGPGARIGSDCVIYPQVVIRARCIIGDRVIIHSGAVIGSDGFGYVTMEGEHRKIPQLGIVQIDDDVEIGAGTTIDRARFGKTHIKKGTKIDNLVQIAHNVVIGENSLLVAQTGVAGSVRTGSQVILAAQSGVDGHVRLSDNVIVGARSGVTRDLPEGARVSGFPAWSHTEELKVQAHVRRLPELVKAIKKLQERISRLESSAKNHKS